ncbi:hypothetical protein [Methylobacterium sp. ID0610]|uniref:hypothetical protein n=1 Tax=Methylobacterium carpenticola TaxID=3344827 RepID=UPI0036BB7A06
MKSLMIAGLVVAGAGLAPSGAQAKDASLAAAGLQPVEVVGFSGSVPKGMPLFVALPRLAPGAEVDLRSVDGSGLVAFGRSMPAALDPNAEIATGTVGK